MRLYRIGEKVISREKLSRMVSDVLEAREAGATQEEVAVAHGVQRTFVSFLESLGEVRRGPRVALVAFPVANVEAVLDVADECAVDFTLVFSQAEREGLESGPAAKMFNSVLDTLATLRDFDVIVLMASDWRISTVEKILGREVVGIPLGHSPLRADVTVDLDELRELLHDVTAPTGPDRRAQRLAGAVIEKARETAGRWTPSKRS